jgi:hypothetical protein
LNLENSRAREAGFAPGADRDYVAHMENELPLTGRVVVVQTKYIGERHGYAPPEIFYVAIDDDSKAIDAVKAVEDFAPSDDRLIEVSNIRLIKGSMSALQMRAGTVKRA